MNGKRYFNEIKKKYAYINYFQSCVIIFLQNSHALQYTSAKATLVFKILYKIGVLSYETISSLQTSPYPPYYCTHINTLHLTHRLTVLTSTHFTLPTVLLYSHQHTSPYPPSYSTHINTLITTNGLNSSVNLNWRNFFRR